MAGSNKDRDLINDGFELLMLGMEVIGNIVGDPPVPVKNNTKSDHPSTFEKSLQEQQEDVNKAKRR